MTWILTASGKKVYFDEPEKSEFDILDIAHALSLLCRFNGHSRYFYSVAQHSYHASYLVPVRYALGALMHDAAEAYLGDVSSPLKAMLPDYKSLEGRMEHAIRSFFDLPPELHPCIKEADMVMLATEKRDLMPSHPEPWPCLEGVEPMHDMLSSWSPVNARICFMRRFDELVNPGFANVMAEF